MASDKFKAMVHLIVASCDDDPHRLGATKLNKICWYSDSCAYRGTGAAITIERYVKRDRGPVPNSMLHALRELEAEGKILVRISDHPIFKKRLYFSLKKPDTSSLSDDEAEIIKFFTKEICDNHTANSISALSHDVIWEAARDGETMPLYATLVATEGEVTPEIEDWANSVLTSVEQNRRGESRVEDL